MDGKPHSNDAERAAEARRILRSVETEMQPTGLARRIGAHFAARDADPEDRIERLGRRIGRALSLALTLALAGWLAAFLFA